MPKKQEHIPVMPNEFLDLLEFEDGDIYIDGTLGLAGHSCLVLEAFPGVKQIGFERDAETLEIARQNLSKYSDRITLLHQRFSTLPDVLRNMSDDDRKRVKAVFFDLGISSRQLDNAKYGISFSKESRDMPLDMRLDQWCEITAADILNKWPERQLSDLFWDYADYRSARPLARAIVDARPLQTMGEFFDICGRFGQGRSRINPATLPLMALRIYINEEYSEINCVLRDMVGLLEQNTTVAVLSFHSGEDRIVKKAFRDNDNYELLFKKPIPPSSAEIKQNPRARSAKLRAAKIIKDNESS